MWNQATGRDDWTSGDLDRPSRSGHDLTGPEWSGPERSSGVTAVWRNDPAITYQRLYEPLCRMAFLLVDTCEQAEEVVQEAFAKALPKWVRLETPEAYVRMCVLNGCRRVHRRRALIRRRPPPFESADTPAVTDHVIDAVRRLPSPQREVIVLRFYLQSTDAEIADTLQIAIGTVKSTLHRAKARLREELQ